MRAFPGLAFVLAVAIVLVFAAVAVAHPLGNFSVNHFARIEVGQSRIKVRYVVDMAEIPTLQEIPVADADGDGKLSAHELDAYAARVVPEYAAGLRLTAGDLSIALEATSREISMPAGAGGLSTLRLVSDLEGAIPESARAGRFGFRDTNHAGRNGWHELVVVPAAGMTVFDSSAFGSAITDGIAAYPEELLMAPLDERAAEWSATAGPLPANAKALVTREGRVVLGSTDRFAALIAVPSLTAGTLALGLVFAFGLGGLHALSPGHGKTVVGAYLVGSRASLKHAAFLGLTVTVTHTLGVFTLGIVTLFASRYVLPERLFPLLSLLSGAIVVTLGLGLFVQRLRAALLPVGVSLEGDHAHALEDHHGHHDHHDHPHPRDFAGDPSAHSHGGGMHTHLPPAGADRDITWKSLLALGISGGLLPCPSALVVLLAAISLGRVGYGLVLIVAFSLGLASVLTTLGLAFVYAGRLFKLSGGGGLAARFLPVVSALVITAVGLGISYQALAERGVDWSASGSSPASAAGAVPVASVLVLGLVLGVKHALEADHLAAVSVLASQRRGLVASCLVGGLWGIGHTISLMIAGIAVIVLQLEIGETLAQWLELGVAIMLILLGLNVVRELVARRGADVHVHTHDGHAHVHSHSAHEHENRSAASLHAHGSARVGVRPLLVGMVHGLAGSAALMLLILTSIADPAIGLLYILVFGLGSVGGMMLMSALVSLPMQLTPARFARTHLTVHAAAGVFSLACGVLMAYEIGSSLFGG